MRNKSVFLKNILTIISILAIILSAPNAMAIKKKTYTVNPNNKELNAQFSIAALIAQKSESEKVTLIKLASGSNTKKETFTSDTNTSTHTTHSTGNSKVNKVTLKNPNGKPTYTISTPLVTSTTLNSIKDSKFSLNKKIHLSTTTPNDKKGSHIASSTNFTPTSNGRANDQTAASVRTKKHALTPTTVTQRTENQGFTEVGSDTTLVESIEAHDTLEIVAHENAAAEINASQTQQADNIPELQQQDADSFAKLTDLVQQQNQATYSSEAAQTPKVPTSEDGTENSSDTTSDVGSENTSEVGSETTSEVGSETTSVSVSEISANNQNIQGANPFDSDNEEEDISKTAETGANTTSNSSYRYGENIEEQNTANISTTDTTETLPLSEEKKDKDNEIVLNYNNKDAPYHLVELVSEITQKIARYGDNPTYEQIYSSASEVLLSKEKVDMLAEKHGTTTERILNIFHNNMSSIASSDDMISTILSHLGSGMEADKKDKDQHEHLNSYHATAPLNTTFATVAGRMGTTTPAMSPIIASASVSDGIAAGDAFERFGIWTQIVVGKAIQKKYKGASGFASNLMGAMVGVDTLINDQTILGFAFGNMINNVKYKDTQAGDKSKSSSLVFSAYGHQQLEDNWFMQGSVAYTKTAVDNKNLRIIGANNLGVAKFKYNIHSFGAELLVGKSIRMQNNIIVIPSVGGRATHTNKISYQESSNTTITYQASQKAGNALQGIAGLQLMQVFDADGVKITPEAHANIAYGLGVKAPKGSYSSKVGSNVISYTGTKPSRLSTTVGLGVTAASGSVECGIGYDANISGGYLSHQGTLKLKVHF